MVHGGRFPEIVGYKGAVCTDVESRKHLQLVIMLSFTAVVFLRKLLVSKELGVHAASAHISLAFDLLDAISVSLVCVVVCASIFLLAKSQTAK